jgi:O-methyltransferase involved in polyketide biosynthesis
MSGSSTTAHFKPRGARVLVEAGVDPNQPAVFLWERVIMYLDRPAVESTLRTIASTA